jgi:hypothetical protein
VRAPLEVRLQKQHTNRRIGEPDGRSHSWLGK